MEDRAYSLHLRVIMSAKLSAEALLSEYFGPFAVPAWKLLPSIEAATEKQTYAFMDPEAFNALIPKEPEQAQAIYWREMMLPIHLACCTSLWRHGECSASPSAFRQGATESP
jgi:hypothetical protein